LPISSDLKKLFKNSVCGVVANRRKSLSYGIRLWPYCEVFGNLEDLKRLQAELLSMSVGSCLRKKSLRIQGINNCSMITQFIDNPWWKDVVLRFVNGEHHTRAGILHILRSRPGVRNRSLRLPEEEVFQLLMDSR